jgi:adenylate kinase family enzyme
MKKIRLFKDNEDYVKIITEDNIINIIGNKGSGKTTDSQKYIDDKDYIVVNCDKLLSLPSNGKEDKELINLKEKLINKYGKIEDIKDFTDCYNYIIDYILKKKKKGLIEGNLLEDMDINSLKGKLIIKRTGTLKCYIRAVKRDYKNEYFMNLEKEKHKYMYKLTRFYKISKRRKSIFKKSKELNKIIESLDK